MTDAPTVFIVDDDPSVRRSTERLVRSMGFRVQSFASAREFRDDASVEGPACLLLDVRMPGQSGLELQLELTRSGVEIPIIFVTGHGSIPMTVRAMKAGAAEFLTKPVRSQELLAAIRAAIDRDRAARQRLLEGEALRERHARLTPREREVMALVAGGLANKQVTAQLHVSEVTVKVHRGQVMRKMRASSLPDLVRMTDRLGLPIEAVTGPIPKS